MTKERFHEIDVLRGLACLMVVVFHYLHRGPEAGWITARASPLVDGLARYGYLGVHLFFIISGFVIFMSAEGATTRRFAASRVARLYPAFWFAAPLTALVAWLAASETFKVQLLQLAVNLTMAPHWFGVEFVDGAYWSLAVELHFYLLVALALATGLLARAEWLVGGWLLLSAANAVRPMFPLEFWLDAKWAPLFSAGICAYLIRTRGANVVRLGLFSVAYLLALGYTALPLLVAARAPGAASGDNPWVVAAAITLFFALFTGIALRLWQLPASRLSVWAGLLTYPVYLLHQNIGYITIEALQEWVAPLGVRAALVGLMIGGIAWVCVRCVEQPLAPRLKRALDAPRPSPRVAPASR